MLINAGAPDRRVLAAMAKETSSANSSLPLHEVLEAEFTALHGKLPADYPSSTESNARLKAIWAAIHGLKEKRAALCISGGGIRSATFGLGVLQGLARCGLLGRFHYLSTVSGGGYIGSWLSAWIHRADGGLTSVAAQLARPRDSRPNPEPVEIQNLRSYSNYLSPRLGLLFGRHLDVVRHLYSESAFDFAGHDSAAGGGVDGSRGFTKLYRAMRNPIPYTSIPLFWCGPCRRNGRCLHGN